MWGRTVDMVLDGSVFVLQGHRVICRGHGHLVRQSIYILLSASFFRFVFLCFSFNGHRVKSEWLFSLVTNWQQNDFFNEFSRSFGEQAFRRTYALWVSSSNVYLIVSRSELQLTGWRVINLINSACVAGCQKRTDEVRCSAQGSSSSQPYLL